MTRLLISFTIFFSSACFAEPTIDGLIAGGGAVLAGTAKVVKELSLKDVERFNDMFNSRFGNQEMILANKHAWGNRSFVLTYTETRAEARERALRKVTEEIKYYQEKQLNGNIGADLIRDLEKQRREILHNPNSKLIVPQSVAEFIHKPHLLKAEYKNVIRDRLNGIRQKHPDAQIAGLGDREVVRLEKTMAQLKLSNRAMAGGGILVLVGSVLAVYDFALAAEDNSSSNVIVAPRFDGKK